MTENEISKILKNAVPGEPRMADLGDKVRGGHRRRRIAQGALAALGVVALGVPVAVQISRNLDTQPPVLATPSPTPSDVASEPSETPTRTPSGQPTPTDPPPAVPPLPNTDRLNSAVCEDAQGTVSEFPDALIPQGVVTLHLCSNDQEAVVPVFGAPEPIIGDFTDLIARVNDAPALTVPTPCATDGDGAFGYLVVLEYADGETLVINTVNVDCLRVVDDGQQTGRGDSEAFFSEVLELLQVQRQTHDYSYVGDENLCLEAESIVGRSIHDVVHGSACGVEPSSEAPGEGIIRNPLPDAVVARIVGEATADADLAPAHGLPLFSQTTVLQTRHGDPMTLYRWDDGSFYFLEGHTWMAWTPSEALAGELATYFEGTRSEPFPEPEQPELCMDPDMMLFDGPLSEAFTAEACVMVDDGVYEMRSMPPEVWDGFIADLEGSSTAIPRDTEFDFTGHWIAVVNSEGRARQLFVTAVGDLVWDDPDDFDTRHQATPSSTVTDWMRSVGIDV